MSLNPNTINNKAPANIFSWTKKYLEKKISYPQENICSGYSLELSHKALLMSTHDICFCGEIRKISILHGLKKINISGAVK